MAHIKLGELLVRAGHLAPEALQSALDEQKKWGGRLGRILMEMDLVSEDILMKALSKQLGLPLAELDRPDVPQELLARIDARFAMENRLCPERYDAGTRTLTVAVEDHLNLPAVDEVAAKTGIRIITSLAPSKAIEAGLALLYPGNPAIPNRQDGDRGQAMFETEDFKTSAPSGGADAGGANASMPMFETKDFGAAASKVQADAPEEQRSSVRVLDSGDFREAAKKVAEAVTDEAPGRTRNLSTDDFTDAAKKARDED